MPGCYSILFDESAAFEEAGIKPWIFSDPPAKVDFSGLVPPSKEAQQIEQTIVSKVYQDFLSDVAKFRGMKAKDVAARFGGGLTINGVEALAVKAVDRLCRPDTFCAELTDGMQRQEARRAANAKLRAQIKRETDNVIRSCRGLGHYGRRKA